MSKACAVFATTAAAVIFGVVFAAAPSAANTTACIAQRVLTDRGTLKARFQGKRFSAQIYAGKGSCSFALGVRLGTRLLTTALPTGDGEAGRALPRLDSVISFGGHGDKFVAVQTVTGASSVIVRLFGLHSRGLADLPTPIDLSYGVSGGSADGIDCEHTSAPAVLVVSSAMRSASRWRVRRVFLLFSRGHVRISSTTTTEARSLSGFREYQPAHRFPGVVDFPSCVVVRAATT